jgi:hypothetical protein
MVTKHSISRVSSNTRSLPDMALTNFTRFDGCSANSLVRFLEALVVRTQRRMNGTYGVHTCSWSLHLERRLDRWHFQEVETRKLQSGCLTAQRVQNRSIVTDAEAEAKMNWGTKSKDVATWYN